MKLIVVCVVLLFLLVPVLASNVDISTSAYGSDFLAQQSVMKWDLSDANLQAMPPIPAGSQLLSGAHTDLVLAKGPALLESDDSLNNSDVVHQGSSLNVQSQGTTILLEGLMLEAEGSPGTSDLCAPSEDVNATPYNERVFSIANVIAHNQTYSSVGGIQAGALDVPDSFNFDAASQGIGYADLWSRAVSQAGMSNQTDLNYQNEIDSRIQVGGKFKVQQSINWTSFSKVFDTPTDSGPTLIADQAINGTLQQKPVKQIEQVKTKTKIWSPYCVKCQ